MAITMPPTFPSCPPGTIKRVVIHWTGGAPKPSALDREHYHYLVDQECNVTPGVHSITDNIDTSDGDYAAHTLNCNQGSVGVSLCGMLDAVEFPFSPGPYPITEAQWDAAAYLVAEICEQYGIEVSPRTVLQHGEVEANLGIKQRAKWDVCKLPWALELSHRQVGNDFRARVAGHLARVEDDAPRIIEASVFGSETDGRLVDSQAVIAVRPLADAGVLAIQRVDQRAGVISLKRGNKPSQEFTAYFLDGRAFVPARKLAEFIGGRVLWEPQTKRLTIS